jgi:hypothetical protein
MSTQTRGPTYVANRINFSPRIRQITESIRVEFLDQKWMTLLEPNIEPKP